jgi:CRISPR/Cas system-associated exonuclease Cas4 (RecB family)
MTFRLAVTEAALAQRCQRQFALAREGIRGLQAGAGIGVAAHSLLERFILHGASDAALAAALARDPADEAELQRAVSGAIHRGLFDEAPAFVTRHSIDELVALAEAGHALAAFLAALILRARRAGVVGEEALTRTLEASEREVDWLSSDGTIELTGRIDLLCRDRQSGESYVVDLKTGLADAAAVAQVQMYALALQREGWTGSPALLHIEGCRLKLIKVAQDPAANAALESRLRHLREIAEGRVTPAAASDSLLCQRCPVQRACWERWGPTLSSSNTAPAESLPGARASTSKSAVPSAVAEDARRLEKMLRARRIPVVEVNPKDAIVGPSVVRYRVKLREGGALARVERAALDLQRDMNWSAEPLIQNDGPFVAIDAPRPDRETLTWSSVPKLVGLRIPVGLALDRTLIKLDLADAPHVLIAGATGSGKTVFLQSLIVSLLERRATAPSELVIVDPKMVDFLPFNRCALFQPVVTDPAEAVALLIELAEVELQQRTARLVKMGLSHRLQIPAGEEPMLPRIVIIDEFADLLMSLPDKKAKQAFLGPVQRLLQKARFAGIHLVIATQRPSVDSIPGSLKANLNVRIAFRLADATNSQIVLDEPGAERLLDRGDLLIKRPGSLVRAQGFFVDRSDIDAVA